MSCLVLSHTRWCERCHMAALAGPRVPTAGPPRRRCVRSGRGRRARHHRRRDLAPRQCRISNRCRSRWTLVLPLTAIHPGRRGERRWAAWSTTASVRVRWRVSTKASSARRSGSKTHPSASWSTWVTTNSLTWRFSMPSSQRLVGNPACPAQLHVDYRFTVDDERPHYQTPAGKAAMKRAEELGAIHIRVTVYADPAGHPSCFLTNQGRHSRDCRDNQPASCMS